MIMKFRKFLFSKNCIEIKSIFNGRIFFIFNKLFSNFKPIIDDIPLSFLKYILTMMFAILISAKAIRIIEIEIHNLRSHEINWIMMRMINCFVFPELSTSDIFFFRFSLFLIYLRMIAYAYLTYGIILIKTK